ncbi:MAG: hypothetical protein OXC81_06835, partial [Betaproteobacteria bacterium]|nr:hypothetical protein [Betaproteobacteria bacterium]
MAADSEGFFALTGLAAIEFAGEHSEQFLQGQLTADVAGLTAGKWQWAGYCTPQGKMLCTALIWRCGEDSIGLVIADDLVADICRRLQMYILRAKTAVQPMQASISGRLDGQPAENDVLTLAGGGWLLGLADGLQLRVGDAAAADADGERQW